MGILDLAVGKWVYTRPCDEHVAQGSGAVVEFHDRACVGQ